MHCTTCQQLRLTNDPRVSEINCFHRNILTEGVNVAPTSDLATVAILILSMVGNYIVRRCGRIEKHVDIPSIYYENRRIGSI